ncbi:rCG51831 [Rattus norvegicus]|uniref:RCG51831 n=1 Tax=Rattus norvegicus TaxID=10116 RepID=A6K3F0_RAT|nr:rCG51831 [Rattus norvegicus]
MSIGRVSPKGSSSLLLLMLHVYDENKH